MAMITFVFLFISINTCIATSPMYNLLSSTDAAYSRITFLIDENCPTTVNMAKKNLKNNDELLKAEIKAGEELPRTNSICSNTIGFVPINKNKVQVFVTVDNENNNVNKVDIYYVNTVNHLFLTCNNEGKSIKDPNLSTLDFEVDDDDNALRSLHVNSHQNIILCNSVYIKKRNTDLEKIFIEGKWTMEVHINGQSNTFTTSDTVDIFSKMRCDPDQLNYIPPTNPLYKFGEVRPMTGKNADNADNQNVYQTLTADKYDSIFKTTVDSSQCNLKNTGAMLVYSLENGQDVEVVHSAYCKKNMDQWQYTLKLSGTDGPDKWIDNGKKITLTCALPWCRTCSISIGDKCPAGSTCTTISETRPDIVLSANDPDTYTNFKKCYALKTDTCLSKLVYLNGEEFAKITPGQIVCEKDKYKINGKEVKSIFCAMQYSVLKNKQYHEFQQDFNSSTENEKPQNCEQNTSCQCMYEDKMLKHLAIPSEDGKQWRRINSIVFDADSNKWNYTRTRAGKSESALYELDSTRVVRCIAAVLQYKGSLKNSSEYIVFIVNAVLLVIFAAIIIPGVMLFVNSKEKKREALKAAKKGKGEKKEDQSGEKKTCEGKKDEGKKNEA